MALSEWTSAGLLAFEEDIAQEFAAGYIRAPIHLSGGNETELINYFRDVQPWDWCLCSWRSHYHCLLKGVPADKLKASIMQGRSVSLCFPKHKILSSGIVGGIAPIAIGLAHSLKTREDQSHNSNYHTTVHVFIGDMTEKSGIVRECMEYGARHDLRIRWIIEDNGLSVCTPTKISWGMHSNLPDVFRYWYNLGRPHAGIGQWVKF